VYIYEKGNKSNTLQPNQTYTDIGVAQQSLSLTTNESELTWVVAFDITRNNSEFVRTVEVTKRPSLVPPIDREWRLIVAIGLLLLSAGAFSVLNAGVGGVVVAVEAALLWFTGWLEGATAFGGVVLALFVAVMVHIYAKTAR
jgi:hypothetical protein